MFTLKVITPMCKIGSGYVRLQLVHKLIQGCGYVSTPQLGNLVVQQKIFKESNGLLEIVLAGGEAPIYCVLLPFTMVKAQDNIESDKITIVFNTLQSKENTNYHLASVVLWNSYKPYSLMRPEYFSIFL